MGVLFLLLLPMLQAQSLFDPRYSTEAAAIGEEIQVFTDREFYLAGEDIRFFAGRRMRGSDFLPDWSRVLYTELITPGGRALAGIKQEVRADIARGSMTIPVDLPSGHYYLRFYTRWMQNRGAPAYSYIPLTIVNPVKTEVLSADGGRNPVSFPHEGLCYEKDQLSIDGLPGHVGQGEEIAFEIRLGSLRHLAATEGCISVVPAGSLDSIRGYFIPSMEHAPGEFRMNYLPETMGLSVSGRVVDEQERPLPYARLHFTLLEGERGFVSTLSDAAGHFAVALPHCKGDNEMIVVPEPLNGVIPRVRVDLDFEQEGIALPFRDFELSPRQEELAAEMFLRNQLKGVFRGPGQDSAAEVREGNAMAGELPFYGKPVLRVEMEDFINLPTLEEVFVNLVNSVNVVKRRGQRSLRITGANSAMAVYPPLIMVDYIPVFDQEALLDLDPDKLRRLDVINEVYVKGNVSFGGIISILSKKGDMAGIDLPPESYFFDYQCLNSNEPAEIAWKGRGSRLPDSRNTILWMDRVRIGRDEPFTGSFRAPGHPGEYLMLYRGLTPGGQVVAVSATFRVD